MVVFPISRFNELPLAIFNDVIIRVAVEQLS